MHLPSKNFLPFEVWIFPTDEDKVVFKDRKNTT